jgi:RNA polymerase sigma factor (sigma-70 family)
MLRLLRQNGDGRAVRRVLNGDGEAFGHLVDRYGRAALAVARAIAPFQAEDALQEAYVLAYRRLDTLEQPHRFGPWLISITRNVALRLRERTRETAPLEHAPEAALSTAPTPERTEIRAVVRHALDALDAAHREVLLLHYFAGNSVAEIATMLDISTDAAKKRLQRARESLSADLLRALGAESAEAYGLTPRRRKQIVAAALAGGAAWQGQAHAAAVATVEHGRGEPRGQGRRLRRRHRRHRDGRAPLPAGRVGARSAGRAGECRHQHAQRRACRRRLREHPTKPRSSRPSWPMAHCPPAPARSRRW